LITLLRDSKDKVDEAAASVLGQIGLEAEIAIPELVTAFRNAKFGDESFSEALTKIGDKGIIALIQLLKDPDSGIRARAASALGRSGIAPKIVVSPLTEVLLDRDDTVCIRAAQSLRNIGESAKKAIPNLIEALRTRASCNRSASDALASIGKDTVLSLARILLQNSDSDVRLNSALALRRIGKDAKAAIPALIKVLKGQDRALAFYAVETLRLIGSDAKEAIPNLQLLLQSQDHEIQLLAAIALAEIGADADIVVPNVPKLIAAPWDIPRYNATQALIKRVRP